MATRSAALAVWVGLLYLSPFGRCRSWSCSSPRRSPGRS